MLESTFQPNFCHLNSYLYSSLFRSLQSFEKVGTIQLSDIGPSCLGILTKKRAKGTISYFPRVSYKTFTAIKSLNSFETCECDILVFHKVFLNCWLYCSQSPKDLCDSTLVCKKFKVHSRPYTLKDSSYKVPWSKIMLMKIPVYTGHQQCTKVSYIFCVLVLD